MDCLTPWIWGSLKLIYGSKNDFVWGKKKNWSFYGKKCQFVFSSTITLDKGISFHFILHLPIWASSSHLCKVFCSDWPRNDECVKCWMKHEFNSQVLKKILRFYCCDWLLRDEKSNNFVLISSIWNDFTTVSVESLDRTQFQGVNFRLL